MAFCQGCQESAALFGGPSMKTCSSCGKKLKNCVNTVCANCSRKKKLCEYCGRSLNQRRRTMGKIKPKPMHYDSVSKRELKSMREMHANPTGEPNETPKMHYWYEAQYMAFFSDKPERKITLIFSKVKSDRGAILAARRGIARNKKALKAKEVVLMNVVEMIMRNLILPRDINQPKKGGE